MSPAFFSTKSKPVRYKENNQNATEQWGKLATYKYGRVIIYQLTVCPQLKIDLILFTLSKKN